MAPEQKDPDVSRYFGRAMTDLYLSIFVVFYRFAAGLWPASFNADAHKGVAGLTIVEGLLCLSAGAWLQVALGKRYALTPLFVGIGFFALYFFNNNFLVSRGVGTQFNKEFSSFPALKRVLLYVGAIAVVIISLITFNISVTDYQEAFGFAR